MNKAVIYLLTTICLAACSYRPEDEHREFVAEMAETRLLLDAGAVKWHYGDEVSVFFKDGESEKWVFTGSDRSLSGRIVAESSHPSTGAARALFPYSKECRIAGDIIFTTLPGLQKNPVSGGRGTTLLVSTGSGEYLPFKHACGYLAVTLDGGADAVSAVLRGNRGEPLAGTVQIDLGEVFPSAALTGEASQNEIRVETEIASTVWFCMPPLQLDSGFNVSFTFSDGSERSYSFPQSVSIQRGRCLQLNLRVIPEEIFKEIDLDFRSGGDALSTALPRNTWKENIYNASTGFPDGKAFSVAGQEGAEIRIYTIDGAQDGGTTGVSFRDADETHSFNYLSLGRQDSYIKLPQIKGYALHSLEMTAGNSAGNPYISSSPDGHSAETCKYYNFNEGDVLLFNLPSLNADQSYYLMLGSSKMLHIYRLRLLYVPAF